MKQTEQYPSAMLRAKSRRLDESPSPVGNFLLGHFFALRKDPLRFFMDCATYGDIVRLGVGVMPHRTSMTLTIFNMCCKRIVAITEKVLHYEKPSQFWAMDY